MTRPLTLPSTGATAMSPRQVSVTRSRPARYPPYGAWPAEMRADVAAAFLDYETTGQLYVAVLRGQAPRPTGERLRKGRREPTWALDQVKAYVANRHEIASDRVPGKENIGELI
jgi:hypothetical protein